MNSSQYSFYIYIVFIVLVRRIITMGLKMNGRNTCIKNDYMHTRSMCILVQLHCEREIQKKEKKITTW